MAGRARVLCLVLATACTSARVGADTDTTPAAKRPKTAVRERVRAYRRGHEREILTSLMELLTIPNHASDRPNIRKNAEYVVRMLEARGIKGRLLEAEGGAPSVYGEVDVPGAAKTLLLYTHYDGQPVDPSEWKSRPYEPVLRDGPLGPTSREIPLPPPGGTIDPEARIYARSASDDKGAFMGLLVALDAMKANGLKPSVRLKLFFEGEGEVASPHLRPILEKNASLLACDGILFILGPTHPSGVPNVTLGVRGFLGLEMTVYGPNRALHSGHYGNWAPNPVVLMTHLIDSMRDEDGTIRIAGINESVRPLTDSEKQLLVRFPHPDDGLRREFGLASSEGTGRPLAERILLPAMNLRGISGGQVGEKASNAIPTETRASLDFRLVPDLTPDRVRTLVEEHIRRQGYFVVTTDPDAATRLAHPRIVKLAWGSGHPATRTAPEAPFPRAFLQSLEDIAAPVTVIPSSGGSPSMDVFVEVLKAPILFFSTTNYDNNQHAANENIRIRNLWDSVELHAGVFTQLGRQWR